MEKQNIKKKKTLRKKKVARWLIVCMGGWESRRGCRGERKGSRAVLVFLKFYILIVNFRCYEFLAKFE